MLQSLIQQRNKENYEMSLDFFKGKKNISNFILHKKLIFSLHYVKNLDNISNHI